jgi:hypothetical protein
VSAPPVGIRPQSLGHDPIAVALGEERFEANRVGAPHARVLELVAAQLDLAPVGWDAYAVRSATRREHLAELSALLWMTTTGMRERVRSSPSLGRCCCTKRWAINVKMLIIDEIHHVFAGPLLKQRHFLNVIKYMGNELQIPIAAAGTHDAFNAIQIDPHSPIGSSRRSCHASR